MLGDGKGAMFDHGVDVLGWQSQKMISDGAADDVTGDRRGGIPESPGKTMLKKRKETRHGDRGKYLVPMLQAIGSWTVGHLPVLQAVRKQVKILL